MVTAYLALGSNLGDRLAALQGARAAIDRPPELQVAASSPLYQTAPVGGPAQQSDYFNAVLQVRTSLPPRRLLRLCLAVEGKFGRERREIWGPRTLDIDLLLYGKEIVRDPELTIPHPRLHLRPFVLLPLADLAAELPHPFLGQTVLQLLARFPESGGIRRLADQW